MKLDWKHWLLGLWAAVIGGGSGGVINGLTAMGLDSEHFNLTGGLRHTLELFGVSFIVNGGIAMFLYLKQSPVPADRDVWTDEQRAAATKPHPLPDAPAK